MKFTNEKIGKTYKLTLSSLFLAIGLVLPFLTGQIPELGNMLLPMHLPVMLCGLILGAPYGALVGIVTPLLRSLIFARPVLYPAALAMAAELATYGAVIGAIYFLSKKKTLPMLYLALVSAMTVGRLVWGATMAALMGFSGFTFSYFLGEAVINAIPGIILQLILIPAVMLLIRRTSVGRGV